MRGDFGVGVVELTLQRLPSDESRTHGDLLVDGEHLCVTLEDKVRDSKIHGRTAIPAGRYRITMETSPRFGPSTLTVNNVPGFTGVRIHSGNTEEDTEGCPLVGMVRLASSIGRSKEALALLKERVADGLTEGEVWLTINAAS